MKILKNIFTKIYQIYFNLQNIHIHHRKINKFAKYCAHLRFIPKRVTINIYWIVLDFTN